MAAPVQPEQVQTEQPPAQTETPAADLPTTTATEQPAPQNNRLLELMEANMRDQAARLRTAEAENTRLRNAGQQSELNPPIPTETAGDFWQNPAANIQKLIREETQRAVKPLYDFKTQMERQSGYDGLKSRFKNDPRYAEIFPKIEGMVDQMMTGAEANDQNMQLAVLSAIGSVVTGQVPGVQLTPANGQQQQQQTQVTGAPPSNQPQQQQGRVITPAHLRSTPVTLQPENNAPATRDLTELEARLAKERGLNKEEYLQWLDLPATQVATSTIGKPKPDANANPQSQVQRATNTQPTR